MLADLLPHNENGFDTSKAFLQKILEILIDFVRVTNDRNEKILDFHFPEDMSKLLDLQIPEHGVSLQQLVNDCATTLKYQVKTGEFSFFKKK